MGNRDWLDSLRTQLKEQALPSWYVERLVQELSDHLYDVEENDRMKADVKSPITQMGGPEDIAQAAGYEYRNRSYLQRHPRMKRLAVPTLIIGLLVAGGLLTMSASSHAADYAVTSRIDDPNGKAVATPKLIISSKQKATVSVQDGATEYRLTVKAGDDTANAVHTIKMTVETTDNTGKKSFLAASRIFVFSDKDATVETQTFKFHVKVTPAGNSK